MKGNKKSALADRDSPRLACTISTANIHDLQRYEPKLETFEIPGRSEALVDHLSADLPKIHARTDNTTGRRRIKSNISQPEISETREAGEAIPV